MLFNNTHYIYYGGSPLHNNRFQITSLNWRSASPTELTTLSDETTNGATILDIKDGPKILNISGGVTYTDQNIANDHMQRMAREIKHIFKRRESYLRLVPQNKTVKLFESNSTTNWTTADDATAIALDTEDYGNNTLKFTVDVSNSANDYATISNASLTQVDVTDYDGFDIPLILSDSYYITSFEIRIGNDSSNYYGWTVSRQTLDQSLQNGANLLSVAKANATETGTVNQAQIDYFYIRVNYNSNQSDFNFKLSSSYAFIDEFTENYLGVFNSGDIVFSQNDGITGDLSNFFDLQVYSPREYSESTFTKELFNDSSVTSLQNTQSFTYDGSKTALPVMTVDFDVDPSNITDFSITCLNTGKSIAKNDEVFSVGDTLKYDFKQDEVSKNNTPTEFEGQTQDFFVKGVNYVQLDMSQSNATTIIDNQSAGTNKFFTIIKSSSIFIRLLQQFTATGTGFLTNVQIDINSNSVSSGYLPNLNQLNIYADSTNTVGSQIGGKTLNPGYLTQISGNIYRANISLNQSVTNGTKYWVALSGTFSSSLSSSAEVSLVGSNTSTYSGGIVAKSEDNGSTYTYDTNKDSAFKFTIDNSPTHSLTFAGAGKTLNY